MYEQRYQVSFKDSGSISRRVYFAQYFRWVGKIRELPMESIASQMLADFLTGDWGMVTNAVSLRVLGEATSYDIVQARAWVGNVVGSSFDTYIEFCKVLPDDTLERIAIAEVKATWVRLVSYGVPSPMPFPEYLQTYLDRFSASTPATLDLKRPETLPLPPLPAPLGQLDTGVTVYQTSLQQGRYGKLLYSQQFQTTLEESNLVGNVLGLVLVDAVPGNVYTQLSPAFEQSMAETQQMFQMLSVVSRLGLLRLSMQLLGTRVAPDFVQQLPPEVQPLILANFSSKTFNTAIAENQLMSRSADLVDHSPLPDHLPLVVLSHGVNMFSSLPPAQAEKAGQVWQDLQAETAQLSTNGTLKIAQNSGHNIHIDQPQLVIDSIRQMVEQVR